MSLMYYSAGFLAVYIKSETRSNIEHILAISAARVWTGGGGVVAARQITSSFKRSVRRML
jgi:hypothetical protein